MATMGMVSRIEMRTGGLEVGWVAFRELVNVNGMLAWRKVLDIQGDLDAGGGGREERGSDTLPLGVDEIDGDRLFGRMSDLGESGGSGQQKQGDENEGLHSDSPSNCTRVPAGRRTTGVECTRPGKSHNV